MWLGDDDSDEEEDEGEKVGEKKEECTGKLRLEDDGAHSSIETPDKERENERKRLIDDEEEGEERGRREGGRGRRSRGGRSEGVF